MTQVFPQARLAGFLQVALCRVSTAALHMYLRSSTQWNICARFRKEYCTPCFKDQLCRAALVVYSRLRAIRAEPQLCFAVTQYVLSPILACSHSKPLIHACAFLLKAQYLLYPSPAALRLLLRRLGPRGLAAVGSLGQPPSARAPKLSSTFFRGTWTLPRSASNEIDPWQVVGSSRGSVCLQLR